MVNLALRSVRVALGGRQVVQQVDADLRAGELVGIVGPNGAGKSTLCDTIIGRVRPTQGHIYFKGEDISKLPEQSIVGRGICRKFQAPGVLPMLSVRDNLALAARQDRRWWRSFGSGIPAADRIVIEETLERVGLTDRADTLGGVLAHGEKQWLEIGMVLATGAQLLLLDEPTAGMGPAETARTAELILGLGEDKSVLVIDHDMSFVEQLAAPVTVMHQGQFLKQGTLAEVRADPQVAAVYLGHAA